jgi:hypothetical protein
LYVLPTTVDDSFAAAADATLTIAAPRVLALMLGAYHLLSEARPSLFNSQA